MRSAAIISWGTKVSTGTSGVDSLQLHQCSTVNCTTSFLLILMRCKCASTSTSTSTSMHHITFLLILMLCQCPVPCTIHLPSVANFHLLSTPNSIARPQYCNNWRFMSDAKFTYVVMRYPCFCISVFEAQSRIWTRVSLLLCRTFRLQDWTMTSRDVGVLRHVRQGLYPE